MLARCFALACCLLLAAPAPAGADTERPPELEEAQLARLKTLVAEHRDDADLLWAYASALGRAGHAAAAADAFERFETRWPKRRSDAALRVGRWRYEAREYTPASAALTRALRSDANSGLAHLYLGLVFARTGDLDRAAQEFAVTSRLEPELAADARLLGGIALLDSGHEDEGMVLLRQLIDLDPDSEPARYAILLLGDRSDDEAVRAEIWVGSAYDSNVPLVSSVDLSGLPSNEDDGRVVWGALLSGRIWDDAEQRGNLTLGARYDGSAHFEWSFYDTNRVTAFGGLAWTFSERVRARLDASVSYATLDDDPYAVYGTVRPSLYFGFGERLGVLRVSAEVEPIEYDETPVLASLERDGVAFGGSFEHFWPVPGWKQSWLSLGARYSRLETEGRRDASSFEAAYDHHRWQTSLSLRGALPWKITADAAFAVSGEDYDERTLAGLLTLDLEEREDLVLEFGLRLVRPLTAWLDLEASYGFVDRDSNVALHSYDRHTAGLSFRFHPLRWHQQR